jgi:hypothetical protein
LEHGVFLSFFKLIKFIAMHHYKKFFIALQELFAAMQQYIRKPYFLIQNRGLAM